MSSLNAFKHRKRNACSFQIFNGHTKAKRDPKPPLLLPDTGFRTQGNLCLQHRKNIQPLNLVKIDSQVKYRKTTTLSEEYYAETACTWRPPQVLSLQGSFLYSEFIPSSLKTNWTIICLFGVGKLPPTPLQCTCLQCKQAHQLIRVPAIPLSCKAEWSFGISGKTHATATL